MRGGRYLVVLAGVGVLTAGCGTKVAPGVDLAAAVTRTAGQSARVAVMTTMQMPGMSVSFTETGVFDFVRSGAIPVDVWVDGQNLVRRVQLSVHLPGGAGAPASARFVQATDFYDFGVPVRVSAPPAAQIASTPRFIKGGSYRIGTSASPPRVSGTLSPDQAAAAEQVVGAFWLALGRNDPTAVAQTVPPAQRSCVQSFLGGGAPKITVTSFRVVSAQPAGNGRAIVRFTVKARASLGGQNLPVFPQGPGRVQWLVTTETAGHWYVDLAPSSAFVFSAACP